MLNMDKLAAQTSQDILKHIGGEINGGKLAAKDLEKMATNSLGVLQEQGVYAFFLYLLSVSGEKTAFLDYKEEEAAACLEIAHLLQMLGQIPSLGLTFTQVQNPEDVNKHKQEILQHVCDKFAQELKVLLLVKNLLEQALIYLRYGAKAYTASQPKAVQP